jgi:hypothetical protein
MSKSIMSDICREFGETSSGSGSVSPPPNPVQGQVLTNKNIQTPYKKPQPKPSMCIVIDGRPNSTTPWSNSWVRHVQRVPDQVVKRVLVLGDICIRNEDDQDVCIRAQVRAGSNSEYQRLEVRNSRTDLSTQATSSRISCI